MAGYTVLNEPQWNLGVSRGILPHIPYAPNISEVSIPTETMHGQMITKFLPFFFFLQKGITAKDSFPSSDELVIQGAR